MSNISLMKDGTIEFEALENAKIVKKIYSKLVRDLQDRTAKDSQQIYYPNNQKLLLQDVMQRIQCL